MHNLHGTQILQKWAAGAGRFGESLQQCQAYANDGHSKKDCKDQESISSNTTPDPQHYM